MPWVCFQCDKWTSFPTPFALSSRIGEVIRYGLDRRAGPDSRRSLRFGPRARPRGIGSGDLPPPTAISREGQRTPHACIQLPVDVRKARAAMVSKLGKLLAKAERNVTGR